ncbi:MAG: hypothetical protein JO249_02890, partial [Acidobacteria bacterium]|nr:hypothetical protein [Acidobacteriota bacterium]
MRFPIRLKIFGIAVGLLILMATVVLLNLRMTRTVSEQLAIVDNNYFPAYVALAQANIRSVEESAYARRLLLVIEGQDPTTNLDALRQAVANSGKASDQDIADARLYINRQINDLLDFDDDIALARLDDQIAALQEERGHYKAMLTQMIATAKAHNESQTAKLLGRLDKWRDDFDRKINAARNEMRRLA